ncbi:MAG: hypothetical protein AAB731_01625 [Patescibacteria group bacterium]
MKETRMLTAAEIIALTNLVQNQTDMSRCCFQRPDIRFPPNERIILGEVALEINCNGLWNIAVKVNGTLVAGFIKPINNDPEISTAANRLLQALESAYSKETRKRLDEFLAWLKTLGCQLNIASRSKNQLPVDLTEEEFERIIKCLKENADQLTIKRLDTRPHSAYLIEKYALTTCDSGRDDLFTLHSGIHLILTYDWQKNWREKHRGMPAFFEDLHQLATEAKTKKFGEAQKLFDKIISG